jgi:hypothetical protein
VHASFVLELQEQPVAALRRERRGEADRVVVRARVAVAVLGGMHVQEGEIALAQGHQVAAGAEVGLGVHGSAVLGHREAQLALRARAGVPASSRTS